MSSRASNNRDIQNHLQTISELLDNNRNELNMPDEPPQYEAPPDYDDIIKVSMIGRKVDRKKKSRRSERRRGERNHNRSSTEYSSVNLEVSLPEENSDNQIPVPSNSDSNDPKSLVSLPIPDDFNYFPSALRAG